MSAARSSSLSFVERAALLDFANGKKVDRAHLDALERRGLVQLVPALTLAGVEMAEAAGWRRPRGSE